MKLTFLGTGTSTGVPSVGCDCETCLSNDPKDKRLRVSILIEHNGKTILVDTSIDFRQQALRANIKYLDAVLITHCHVDHVFRLGRHSPAQFSPRRDGNLRRRNCVERFKTHLSIHLPTDTFRRRSAAAYSAHDCKKRAVLHRQRFTDNAARSHSRQTSRHRLPF